ncbi:hypothetical protein [Mesoplasma florum]|uniref:hypothetical protein n=1 Tax=Mesoplasma florum TaxID=2151 RepID=UPI000BE23AF5|nr:hypothetical protein [Mesoplasma florum]ATI74096.1 hypothetical protein CQZ70_02455 [Mesoplasma florum]
MNEKIRFYNAAIGFNWLALVIWFLVGLAGGNALGGIILCAISACWIVPMTFATRKARDELMNGIERSHLVLGICSIIFIWVVSGVLILIAYTMCAKCNRYDQGSFPNKEVEKEEK